MQRRSLDRPSPERWQRIQRLLDAALTLAPADLPAFLARECADDTALADEVARLVRSCRASGAFLARPVASLVAPLLARDRAATGSHVGPYRIVGEAGRGGMGVVYVGERDDGQFQQTVALKILSIGLYSEQVVRRFLAERQILATLQHPNIARVFDGGVTAEGAPWFAMEYVEGEAIDKYCETRALSVRARLDLMTRVCDAVQFAHQRLVVHRDLKPSNLLVTADGTVKLLDFGVAKLLTPDESAEDLTTSATRWFTPSYASPEQVRGEPVTTMSDVYALGVLLFELLTGERPYRITSPTPSEIERVVCTEDPPRPSEVVASGRKSRAVDTDLDMIVLTAMRKDPARRYPTAGALGEDIRRHLTGLPVRARTETPAYLVSRFVRRHRVGVVASGAVLAALAAGIIGTATQARVARQERDHARRQAATASRVSRLLVDALRLSDPASNRGGTATARDVLAESARRVRSELQGDAEVRATLLGEIGRVYDNLGLPDDAEPLVRESLAIWRSTDSASAVASSLDQLGELDQARAHYDSAESHFGESLAILRSLHPGPDTTVAVVLRHLADALSASHRTNAADSLYAEALAMRRAVLGPGDPGAASVLFARASNLHEVGDMQRAEPLFRDAIALYRTAPKRPDPEVATALSNLATLLSFREEYDESERLVREALSIRQQIYPPGHPAIVESMENLGGVLYNASRLREADSIQTLAVAGVERLYGDAHPDVQASRQTLGAIRAARGHYGDAKAIYRQALAGWRVAHGEDTPSAIFARILLARAELGERKDVTGSSLDAAELDFRTVLARIRAKLGPSHPYAGLALAGLGSVARERSDLATARAAFDTATTILAKLRKNHPYVLSGRVELASVLGASGQRAEALAILDDVLAMQRTRLPRTHMHLSTTLHEIGVLRVSEGDGAAAEGPLREALAIRRLRLDADHWQTAETESALGTALAAQGRRAEAAPLLRHALATLGAKRGESDWRTRQTRARLAALETLR